MDPNALIAAIRDTVSDVIANPFSDVEAQVLAENFAALDDWLSSGGFLPDEWDR